MLDGKRSFENFVLTKENTQAFRAAKTVALMPGKVYNPLYIYGGTGTGKTYLLHCIEACLAENDPEKKVLHVTTEEFCNGFVEAIRAGTILQFRERYRSADVLLIDDIQYLSGMEGTTEELICTFNTFYESGRQLVIVGRKAPEDMTDLDERLAGRLGWGHAVNSFVTAFSEIRHHPEEQYRPGKRKNSYLQVNYRQACRTFMDHPDEIVRLFYQKQHNEIGQFFKGADIETIRKMRRGVVHIQNDDVAGHVSGKCLDGRLHICCAAVCGCSFFLFYNSRIRKASMYRTKNRGDEYWLQEMKYDRGTGNVFYEWIAAAPEKEKDIKRLLRDHFEGRFTAAASVKTEIPLQRITEKWKDIIEQAEKILTEISELKEFAENNSLRVK